MESSPKITCSNDKNLAIIQAKEVNIESLKKSNMVPNGDVRDFLDVNQSSVHVEEQDGDTNEEVSEWVDEGNEDKEDRISLGMVGKLWSEHSLNPNVFMITIKNV